MEQEPPPRCRYCENSKPRDQFPPRKRNHKHGARGEPSSSCIRRTAKARDRREIKKRKRDEEGLDTHGDTPEPDRVLSIEQFTTLLPKKALTGVISCSARVPTEGIDGKEGDICSGIVGRVWEATGFRFTYKMKHVQTDGTVQRVYQCCQTTASSNNREKKPKTDPEQDKKGRDTRRMSRFACNGMFYVTARNGTFDCLLKHSLVGSNGPAVSPLPILSSPSRSHPTGVDSIPRESEPSGFSQPLSREEIYDNFSAYLEKTRKLWESQQHQGSIQWMNNMTKQFKPGFKCVDDILTHENRHT